MGKSQKKQKQQHTNHHDNPLRSRNAVVRRQHSQRGLNDKHGQNPNSSRQPVKASVKGRSNQQHGLKVPFTKNDCILLVGEGDFTFTLSLARNHPVSSITATCFDNKDELELKYPDVKKTVQYLQPSQQGLEAATDTNENHESEKDSAISEQEWTGFSPSVSEEEIDGDEKSTLQMEHHDISILYDIDATKLTSTHKKLLRPKSPFSKIVFNFPHVGGLSTDVNRQVRANQQLLVGFFNAAKPLLATTTNPITPPSTTTRTESDTTNNNNEAYTTDEEEEEEYEDDPENEANQPATPQPSGQILVTLFESEPYTLWNIRDLARHTGLKVIESFKFPWSAYPGYRHARTIGDITTGKDRSAEGKRKGAWRGEERDARCYVLTLKDEEGMYPEPGGSRKRRKGEDVDGDSD